MRQCGECSLCCKLPPMNAKDAARSGRIALDLLAAGLARPGELDGRIREFDKPAGARCQYQRHGKGCTVYPRRPYCCELWNCRWLVNDDTAELSRPDRAHYVIDVMPDVVRAMPSDGVIADIPVVQVWCDPNYPDAHRDPALRAYLERRGREGMAALIRYNESDAFVLFPPSLTGGAWREERDAQMLYRKSVLAHPDTWTARPSAEIESPRERLQIPHAAASQS